MFRPTILMERVSRYVEEHPGLSGRAIVAAMAGKNEHKRLALELLRQEGFITIDRAGSSLQHKSAHPFRDKSSTEEEGPEDA